MADEVIEMSIDETNELRAKLGLKPLRIDDNSKARKKDINVEESNEENEGRTQRTARHVPAENTGALDMAKRRIEESKLKREVKLGLDEFERTANGELTEESTALDWAAKMRAANANKQVKAKKRTRNSTKRLPDSSDQDHLMRLKVAHTLNVSEADASDIVLTLRDESILKKDEHSRKILGVREPEDDDDVLENAAAADAQRNRENLLRKRQLELSKGHPGGYTGWDDDQFDELGGIGDTGFKGGYGQPTIPVEEKTSKLHSIGDLLLRKQDQDPASNSLFTSQQSAFTNNFHLDDDGGESHRIASDIMTPEEMAAHEAAQSKLLGEDYSAKLRKKLEKKEKKLFKKLKKKAKTEKKRKLSMQDSDDEQQVGTAHDTEPRIKEEDDNDSVDVKPPDRDGGASESEHELLRADVRRKKFEVIMEKGNARTEAAFRHESKSHLENEGEVGILDDSFLDTALAKARRLRRLKAMAERNHESTYNDDAPARGVLDAIKTMEAINPPSKQIDDNDNIEGVVKFEFDETKEFSRALLARSEIAKRSSSRNHKMSVGVVSSAKDSETIKERNDGDSDMDEDQNMESLAKEVQIEKDEEVVGFGSTAHAAPLGRGLAGALSMLKATGDITGKNAGKEEMRGRAKDERTYEDYEHLDLQKVVKIDLSTATEKDKEFALREINLDYRDSQGRLLTRKEAWRQLCYQFHGHGSSYKNEERRNKQMQREIELRAKQAEAAERGTLGALKATQKVTGKAFIVHKTS